MERHLPPQWRQRLMAVVNARGWDTGSFHPEVLRLLDAWARSEGGTAQWNPLNTTLALAGSTDYNKIGVQNYRQPVDGMCATAMTLATREPDGSLRYGRILGWMQNPLITADEMVARERDLFSRWGTDPDLLLAVLAS